MKIPLTFSKGYIVATALLRAKRYRVFGSVDILIDTGSPESFISEGNAMKNNIPITKLEFAKHQKIGGCSFSFLKMYDVTLHFHTEEEKSEKLTFPMIYVAISVKRDRETLEYSLSMPTLLGTDFLLKEKLSFYCNLSKNVAYLERED